MTAINSITVFHAKPEIFSRTSVYGIIKSLTARDIHDLFVSGGTDNEPNYNRVARVATSDLDRAHYATNHVAHAWQENEDVEAFTDSARSSSIGDLFMLSTVNHDGSETNELYVCAPMGFEKIS